MLPQAHVITDCRSLYDALEKSESVGLGLTEKRTAIEVSATRQQMQMSGIQTRWVNSDRQLADVLTKPNASPSSIMALQKSGKWKIVFDEDFVSAKKIRRQKRDQHFTNKGTNQKRPASSNEGAKPRSDNNRPKATHAQTSNKGRTAKHSDISR